MLALKWFEFSCQTYFDLFRFLIRIGNSVMTIEWPGMPDFITAKNKHRGFFISYDSLRIQSTFRMTKSFQTVFKTWKETRSIAVKEWKSWIFFMAIFVNQISRLLGKYVTNWLKFAQVWSTKLMNMINLVKLFFSRVNLQNDANAVIVIFLHSNKPLEKIVRLMFSFLISTFDPTRW